MDRKNLRELAKENGYEIQTTKFSKIYNYILITIWFILFPFSYLWILLNNELYFKYEEIIIAKYDPNSENKNEYFKLRIYILICWELLIFFGSFICILIFLDKIFWFLDKWWWIFLWAWLAIMDVFSFWIIASFGIIINIYLEKKECDLDKYYSNLIYSNAKPFIKKKINFNFIKFIFGYEAFYDMLIWKKFKEYLNSILIN